MDERLISTHPSEAASGCPFTGDATGADHDLAVGPARQIPGDGAPRWIITRYNEALSALADPRLSNEQVYPTDCALARLVDEQQSYASANHTVASILSRAMITADPPVHTRLRKLVIREFSAKRMDELRPRVEAIAEDLLDRIADRGEVDLMKVFGFPFPVRVLGEVLGVPEDIGRQLVPPEDQIDKPVIPMDVAHAAAVGWVEQRRRAPTGDLLSRLVAAHNAGALSYEELVAMPLILLIAGHLTTIHLIGNSVLTLLQNPDQLAELRRDPARVPNAVSEVLRHVGPATLVSRYAKEDLDIGGVRIPAGSFVRVMLRAANHDPDRFVDPGKFDILRGEPAELAFGHGVHHCLGARLARLEGEVGLGALLRRFPRLSLAGSVGIQELEDGVIGVETLPVRLR